MPCTEAAACGANGNVEASREMLAIGQASHARWSARLDVVVERSGNASVLGTRRHVGPLRIQRPFYPEGREVPHVYVLHPPGGLVGGDRLETHVSVRDGASALFTTPAAQKLYRSDATTDQLTGLNVQGSGSLEWFPAETIAFDGAHARATCRVTLEPNSAFVGWDILCFGRTASALPFSNGELRWAFEIVRAGTPLSIDRIHVRGGSPVLSATWGYQGLPVFGTLYCVPRDASTVVDFASVLAPSASEVRVAVTAVDGCLIVRSAGSSVEGVRRSLEHCWALLRPSVLGRVAVPPRIWAV